MTPKLANISIRVSGWCVLLVGLYMFFVWAPGVFSEALDANTYGFDYEPSRDDIAADGYAIRVTIAVVVVVIGGVVAVFGPLIRAVIARLTKFEKT